MTTNHKQMACNSNPSTFSGPNRLEINQPRHFKCHSSCPKVVYGFKHQNLYCSSMSRILQLMYRVKTLKWVEYTYIKRKQFKRKTSVTVPARIYNFIKKELILIKISRLWSNKIRMDNPELRNLPRKLWTTVAWAKFQSKIRNSPNNHQSWWRLTYHKSLLISKTSW